MGALVSRGGAPLALKGELAELLGDQLGTGDLVSGVSLGFPLLSIKGKVFHIKEGGEAELVEQPDNPGEPATSLEVVLIKANPRISKVYYEDGYEEGSDQKPTCYSNDGIKPAPDGGEVQCSTCAACPKNAWGSRITDNGSKGKACADSRRVAVAAAGDIERVMLLRVPAASLKPLMQYGQTLTKRGIPYQAVVTKLSFDYTVAHPLLKFSAVRGITVEQARLVKEAVVGDVTEAILHGGNAVEVAAEVAADAGLDEVAAEAAEAAAELADVVEVVKPEPAVAVTKPKRTPKATAPVVTKEAVAAAVAEKPAVATTPVADDSMESALDDLLKDFN